MGCASSAKRNLSIRRGMSIGRDIPRPSQCMPALSRARWPCTNAQCNVAPDDCNHSEFSVDCALLIGGEDLVFEIAAMVRKIDRAVQPPYSFCDVEGHGHLDTVHGLGRVDKQRNDVCTKCYGPSKFSYELWELWPRPSPIGPPCPGGYLV